MPRATLENYVKANALLRKMAAKPVGSEIPIKITQFCGDQGVRDNLFTVLRELKAIEPVIGEKREGTIFSWTYKQASNEGDTALATRVMAVMAEKARAYYDNWAAKQKDKPKATTKTPPKSNGLTIKAGADGVNIRTKETPAPVAHPAPGPVEVQAPVAVEVQAPVAVEVQAAPAAPKQARSLSLSMEGVFNKEDLLRRIQALIDDQEITSFSLDVKY